MLFLVEMFSWILPILAVLVLLLSLIHISMLIFTKLKFQDFAKFGWPLLIISWILCIAILPQVFPFF